MTDRGQQSRLEQLDEASKTGWFMLVACLCFESICLLSVTLPFTCKVSVFFSGDLSVKALDYNRLFFQCTLRDVGLVGYRKLMNKVIILTSMSLLS